ncbi:MAG: DUF4386 domain-containing protein [Betaproteobacteria bacterium]|nr:DUF4386 domain-containing protein [Betaproteobacteria bacterium]
MTSTRRSATIAGVLFFVGTAAGVLSVVGAADSPGYLRELAAHGTQVVVGALFQCVMAVAYVGVAVALYPVLRTHSPTAAAVFLGFRIAAGVLNLVGVVILMLLLDLSNQFVDAGAPASSHFQTLGGLLRSARDLMNHVAMIWALSLGDVMYYWVLYQARLVARWLSSWGFGGLALTMSASFLVLCRLIEVVAPTYLALNAVLVLQQVVLAIWLVARGLNASTEALPPR